MNDPGKPLDHATARIITELTAGLLPLLKETVSAELSTAVKSLPLNVDREAEEARASLKRLKELSEDMTNALTAAQSAASRLSDELLPLSRACETISAAAERLDAARENGAEKTEANELLRSLEANLSDWGGVLKANALAQTRELSEFSTEVSEQIDWIKSAMPGVIGDVFGKSSEKSIRILEMRLTGLEKIGKIIILGGVVLTALLTALWLK